MTLTVYDKSDILPNRKIKAIMKKKYPSKISYGLLSFIFFVFYAPIIPSFLRAEINSEIIGFIAFESFVFALIVFLFLKTEYVIDKTQLVIKCGFFSYKSIDIEKIKEISKTKSIQSSPAPSFDRIEIKYGKFDEMIISPQNKFSFVKDLVKISPSIKNNLSE